MPPLNTNPIVPNQDKKHWKFVVAIIIGLLIFAGLIFFVINNNKKPSTNICSGYFPVCLQDSVNKWSISFDTLQDFGLVNVTEGISLFFVYSSRLEFKESNQGFTSVSFLGQNKQAYKDTANGLTRIITGTKIGEKTLIVLLASEKDISAETLKEIIEKIIIQKNDIRK